MTHAYDEDLVDRARQNLGWMLDLAVENLSWNLSEFYQLFLSTKYAKTIGIGSPYAITGTSGFELAFNVLEETNNSVVRYQPIQHMGYSPTFWTGWALAYYQWTANKSFQEINDIVPIEDVRKMYSPYHEMDISHFCEEMNRRIK